MEFLYKFRVYCGRMGDLYGIWTAEESEIKKLIGETIYFGEVLGKHSEIEVTLKEEHFEKCTDDQSFIEKFKEFNCASGIDPRDFIDEEEEE